MNLPCTARWFSASKAVYNVPQDKTVRFVRQSESKDKILEKCEQGKASTPGGMKKQSIIQKEEGRKVTKISRTRSEASRSSHQHEGG